MTEAEKDIKAIDSLLSQGQAEGRNVFIVANTFSPFMAQIEPVLFSARTGQSLAEVISATQEDVGPHPSTRPAEWDAGAIYSFIQDMKPKCSTIGLWGFFAKEKGNIFKAAINYQYTGFGHVAEIAMLKAIDKFGIAKAK
jgi:hypothetical protein